MSAHTPGPWVRWPSEPFLVYPGSDLGKPRGGAVDPTVDRKYAVGPLATVREGSAFAEEFPHRIGPDAAEANARLIAAAPDLLNGCELAVMMLGVEAQMHRENQAPKKAEAVEKAIGVIRAAIAKAEAK